MKKSFNVLPVPYRIDGNEQVGFAKVIFWGVPVSGQTMMMRALPSDGIEAIIQGTQDLLESCNMPPGSVVPVIILDTQPSGLQMVIGVNEDTQTFARLYAHTEASLRKHIDMQAHDYITGGHAHCPRCIEAGGIDATCAIEQRMQEIQREQAGIATSSRSSPVDDLSMGLGFE